MFIKVNSLEEYESVGEADIIDISKEGNSSLQLDILDETISLAKLFILQYNDDDVFEEDPLNTSIDDEKSKMSAVFKPFKIFCDNLGHLCTVHAKHHKINQVIFGNCLSDDIIIKQLVTKSINIHSDNSIKPIFLRHERYLEGIGGLLSDSSLGISQTSWTENYCESSALRTEMFVFQEMDTYQLTLDSLDNLVTFCPVLSNPAEYFPDTQNLSENSSAREYWLDCISEGFKASVARNIVNVKNESINNYAIYGEFVLKRLEYLRENHDAYGYLTMRVLQDTLEDVKREMGLIAMYEKKKQHENATAIKELVATLNCLDSLDYDEQLMELVKYLLAGNMFDWGAKEVAKLMIAGKLNFHQAMDKLPERPWLVDDLNHWVKRFKESNYKSAMIFADNSGYDFVLGVLPFARELIRRGAKVVVCANSEPVLNDVTFYDLKDLFEEIKKHCPILRKAIEEESLSVMKLAKNSCCLDLCFIDIEIAERMKEMDLLVIEGMGRAVHTNLYAQFKCDTLRVAVIKDHWLSRELGGDEFSCICKFSCGDE
ncbi:4'-phosphopantetheine phosphatase isoform X1 [Halyomorpha halys]